MLGLPDGVRALLFDLDGVITDTASVHRAAWKQMFDAFLERRGQPPFTAQDYLDYVDGKPREDGVRSFLKSRAITLPEGAPGDPAGSDTVNGLAAAKNEIVLAAIDRDGVTVYEDSVAYLDAARSAAVTPAVVSSSANTRNVLERVGLLDRFSAIVDGVVIADEGLAGKPAPDSFLRCARELGAEPGEAAVFEDAIAGVQAGHAGRFGAVIGVNRGDDEVGRALAEGGATRVVRKLTELLEVQG